MVCINEFASATSIAYLKAPCSVIGAKLQTNFEVFLIHKQRVVSRRLLTETSKEVSLLKQMLRRKRNDFSRDGRSHGCFHHYFKVSDTDEPVPGLNENRKVELKTDNVQSFNTRWDETSIAMKQVACGPGSYKKVG